MALKTCDACESVLSPKTEAGKLFYVCTDKECGATYEVDSKEDQAVRGELDPQTLMIRNAKAIARDGLLPINPTLKCVCGTKIPPRMIREKLSKKYISICPVCGRNYS